MLHFKQPRKTHIQQSSTELLFFLENSCQQFKDLEMQKENKYGWKLNYFSL